MLVNRACTELDVDGGSADAVAGDAAAWEAAGVDPADAREALSAVAQLLAVRGSPIVELKTAGQRDRAAVLKMILYDQLPEASRTFAEMVTMQDQSEGDDAMDVTVMNAELQISEDERAAVRFLKRLELFPSDKERDQERLRRLRAMPLAAEAARLAAAEPELAELGAALAGPLETRLYAAARAAQLRARPAEETSDDRVQVVSLEFNILQAIGALVVIIVLAYASAQAVKGALAQRSGAGPDQMPEYSLRSGAQPPR